MVNRKWLAAPCPAGYAPYWVWAGDESSPLLGAGVRQLFVKQGPKHMLLRNCLLTERDSISFRRWADLPHTLALPGQPFAEVLASLHAGGEPFTPPPERAIKRRKRRKTCPLPSTPKKSKSKRGASSGRSRTRPSASL